MANFVFRIVLEPHPWPFSWGPWGRSNETICREMDDGTIAIWQRDKKGKDGMVDEPMLVVFSTYKSSCETTIDFNSRTLQRKTRL